MAKKKKEKKEVCETFEVNNKVKESCGEIEIQKPSKKTIESQNRLLRNILIFLGIITILILLWIHTVNSSRHFSYRGLRGDVVKEGNIIFYQNSFPIKFGNKIIKYNIYLRNNPEKLDKIPFNGEMVDFRNLTIAKDGAKRLVLNMTDNFNCDGDENIAVANLLNIKAFGIRVVKDPNATCDKQGRYIYANVKKSNSSEINQIGNACYELDVNDCDILKVLERFMVEMFVKYNEINS